MDGNMLATILINVALLAFAAGIAREKINDLDRRVAEQDRRLSEADERQSDLVKLLFGQLKEEVARLRHDLRDANLALITTSRELSKVTAQLETHMDKDEG